ncbi:MAG: outer membrane protein assembly factor BamD [Alphaproteobacteria bacterium]|nr:outer membrane protein assembly factor BamD [Alphaproteobacteria bacterium]
MLFALLALALGTAHAAPRHQPTAEELYEQGLRQMRRGYYTKALESFNRVRNYHRDDPVSVKAQLAIADLQFKKGDYQQARFSYEEFASLHPRHPDLDYVVWRIGQSIWKGAPKVAGRDQTLTKSAVTVWTGFDARFPDSEYRDDVDKLLERGRERLATKELFVAKFYARTDSWGAVRGRTEYLVRKYPDVPQVAPALQYLGTSLHAWGEVDAAAAVRDRLAEAAPDSRYLRKLDHQLSKPPGEPPDEKVFVRPYRIRGLGSQQAPQQ